MANEDLKDDAAAGEAADAPDEFENAFAEFSRAREERDDEQQAPEPETVVEDTPLEADAPEGAEEDKPEWQVQLDEAQKRASDWEHRYRSDLGRQAALQKKISDLEAKIQESGPRSDESRAEYSGRMQGLMEDYPEIAQALQDELDRRLGSVNQELTPMIEERERRERSVAEDQVKNRYPDFTETVRSREFLEWYSGQPQSIQRLAASDDPSDAIAMLDFYSAVSRPTSNPAVQEIREKRSQALARNVSVRNTAPAPTGDAPDDFEAAFSFYAKQRERQRKQF